MTTSFEGKKLDYKCTYIHHPPIWALSALGFYFCLEILFLSVLGSIRSSSWPCPPMILPKGFADLCTSFLGHSLPHHHPLHTYQWPKCVQWSHRRHQKWCMHHECAHRDTCTRFCTLGLNLSMTWGAGTFLIGLKKSLLGGRGEKADTRA